MTLWDTTTDRSDDPFWVTGGCLILAQALKKELGRKASLVDVVEPDGPGFRPLYGGTPHHVLVRFGGYLWDARGRHTDAEVIDAWEKAAPKSVRRPLNLEPHHTERARDVSMKTFTKASLAVQRAARVLAATLAAVTNR